MSSNPCNNLKAVAFVLAHRTDAAVVAMPLKLPTEFILGLAAHESQYGEGRIANAYNNFFSMHAPAPFQSGAVAPLGNAKIKVAIYPSFLECGRSFAARFGRTLVGLTNPADFANELVRIHYNSGKSANGGKDGYANDLTKVILKVKERMACIK